MAVEYKATQLLTEKPRHYCPGCGHGIIHRLVAEAIEELDVHGDVVGISPVGCSVFANNYFNFDMVNALHGRAPAVGTGIKRAKPDSLVFTYQGDGDLASIGAAEVVHAAMRGEKISTVFVNNAIYGMTGGQMAPTTLVGQKTTTSPNGRDEDWCGSPIRICEMLATLSGVALAQRVTVDTPAHVNEAKKAIREHIDNQEITVSKNLKEKE